MVSNKSATMSAPPVAIIQVKCLQQIKVNQKVSRQGKIHAKVFGPTRLKEGTLDISLCEDMELRIKCLTVFS